MNIKMIFEKNRFSSFFWTQFLGAFNDNFLKNALVVLVAFRGVQLMGLDSASLVAVASGLFILPYFIFSPLAGQLADKYEKSSLVRKVKLLEIIIMLFAALGFFLQNYILLLAVLFFMGLQSAFFGPVKYSLIPELVGEGELTEGNAFIELGTFLAILLGTILGGVICSHPMVDILAGVGLITVAIFGYTTSRGVPKSKVAAPNIKLNYNPFPEYISLWKIIREKTVIFNSVLAISWFWFFGAGVLSVLPIYIREYLMGNEQVVTLFLAMFTIGIGTGSILCEKMSYKRVEIGIVPIGSMGLTLFLFDLYFIGSPWATLTPSALTVDLFIHSYQGLRLLFDFLMMSVFGGIFIVPLYTLLQDRSDEKNRSRVIAANNIMNAAFMVASSILIIIFYQYHLNPAEIFLIFSILNLLAAVYIYFVVPEFTLRFYSWVLSRIVYSVKTTGIENIPKEGAFILACNHVSFTDWLIISGACKRPIRFVMYYKFFKFPIVKWFMKQYKVIPIAGAKEDLTLMNKAFDSISSELKNQNAVCIFPEGQLTFDGKLSGFRPGITRILEKDPVPVIPVALHGMWGSIFSRKKKRGEIHRRFVTVEFLKPIAAKDVTPVGLEDIIAGRLGETPPHKRDKKNK